MPIGAMVVTLSEHEGEREAALEALRADPRVLLGELDGRHLPLVLETATVSESITAVEDEWTAMPGVVFVNVIEVDFSDLPDREEKLPPRRKRRNRS